MPLGEYLAGVGFFLPTVAAAAFAAVVVTRRRYAYLRGTELVLAGALWLTLAMLAAHVVPLALGVMTRGTVVAASLGIAAASCLIPAAPGGEGSAQAPGARTSRASLAIAIAGLVAVVVYQLALVRGQAVNPFTHVDVVSFHLPGIARWIESGSMWEINQLVPFHVTGNYPNNGDVLTMASVLPWHDVAFARFVPIVFLGLAGLGTFALARELGAPSPTAVLAGALVVALPAASDYAHEGLPDVIFLFGFSTGILFLLRHWRTAATSDLVVAGLGLGLALGTKWYGLTVAASVMLVWLAAMLIERRALGQLVRQVTALIGLMAIGGGIWLLRNWIESGNPIFPQEIGLGPITIFGGAEGTAVEDFGFTIADYIGNGAVLDEFILPGFWDRLGLAGPLLLIGVIAAAAFAWRRLRSTPGLMNRERGVLALCAMAALIACFYAITPGSAPGFENQPASAITVRWLVPAPLLAAAVVAAGAAWLGRTAVIVDALLFIAILDAIHHGRDAEGRFVAQALVALVVVVLLALAAKRLSPRLRAMSPSVRIVTAIGASVMALIVVIAAGRADQRRFDDIGYADVDPAFAWIVMNAPEGQDIGIAGAASLDGVNPILPAFGPRLRNDVSYVGPWRDGVLRDYEDRTSFVAALRRDGYDLLLVGRGLLPNGPVRQERWARSAGFRPLTSSDRLALYARPDHD